MARCKLISYKKGKYDFEILVLFYENREYYLYAISSKNNRIYCVFEFDHI